MVEIRLKSHLTKNAPREKSDGREQRRRVCLLTGAAGRLGAAFISRYGANCDIIAAYHDKPLAGATQESRFVDPLRPSVSLPENQARAYAVQADLASAEDLRRLVEVALARFDHIDLLINAAADTRFHGSLLDSCLLDDKFRMQMDINILAPMRLTALIAQMHWKKNPNENRRFGRNVINVSSVSGLRVFPNVGQAMYGASKAALNHLTAHLSAELKPLGVRCNALAPTRFPDRIPTDRVIDAIARIDKSDMTGKVIVVDEKGEDKSLAGKALESAVN